MLSPLLAAANASLMVVYWQPLEHTVTARRACALPADTSPSATNTVTSTPGRQTAHLIRPIFMPFSRGAPVHKVVSRREGRRGKVDTVALAGVSQPKSGQIDKKSTQDRTDRQ